MRAPLYIRMIEYDPGPTDWRARLRLTRPALRLLVGSTFTLSGLLKIAFPDEFAKALESYQFIPALGVEIAALLLPQTEVILGLLLLFAIKTRAVSGLAALLLVIFTTLSVMALLGGRAIDCGCFPVAGAAETGGPGLLIRNGLLTLCCLWVAKGEGQPKPQQ